VQDIVSWIGFREQEDAVVQKPGNMKKWSLNGLLSILCCGKGQEDWMRSTKDEAFQW